MPRATMRQSGERAVTLRIEHHLDERELQMVLCDVYRNSHLPELVESDPPLGDLEDEIRTHLHVYSSDHAEWWTDDVQDEGEAAQLEAWAQRQVDRLGWFS